MLEFGSGDVIMTRTGTPCTGHYIRYYSSSDYANRIMNQASSVVDCFYGEVFVNAVNCINVSWIEVSPSPTVIIIVCGSTLDSRV